MIDGVPSSCRRPSVGPSVEPGNSPRVSSWKLPCGTAVFQSDLVAWIRTVRLLRPLAGGAAFCAALGLTIMTVVDDDVVAARAAPFGITEDEMPFEMTEAASFREAGGAALFTVAARASSLRETTELLLDAAGAASPSTATGAAEAPSNVTPVASYGCLASLPQTPASRIMNTCRAS